MFSYRLREALALRQLTQEELSERTRVSQSHISRISTGEREPTIDIAVRLAYALEVPLAWLCGVEERAPDALSPDETELLRLYRGMDASFRDVALKVMRTFPATTSDG